MLDSRESLHADPRRDQFRIRREAVVPQAQHVLRYCQGSVHDYEGDYQLQDIVVKSVHINSLPLTTELLAEGGLRLAEAIARDISARSPYINYYIGRGEASVILSTHDDALGIIPERTIAIELRKRQFQVPNVFPVIGQHQSATERAIVILGRPPKKLDITV